MYKPDKMLTLTLDSILGVVSREDPTLISLHGAKITLLFLQEYIITEQPSFLTAYLQCCNNIMAALDKISLAENLDIVELVLRSYLFFSQ